MSLNMLLTSTKYNVIEWLSISDIIFLTVSFIVVLILSNYVKKTLVSFTGIILYFFSLYLLLYLSIKDHRVITMDTLTDIYTITNVNMHFINLYLLMSLLFLVVFYEYIRTTNVKITIYYPLVIICSIISMLLLLCSRNMIVLFFIFEILSICFYVLTAYKFSRRYQATLAAFKYFTYGSLAGALWLFGSTCLLISTGSLDIDTCIALNNIAGATEGFEMTYLISNIGFLFIIISLFLKLGIAPFHIWLPDVYTQSASIVTLLFLTLPKIPYLYLLTLFNNIPYAYLFYAVIICSLCLGTLLAASATDYKSFMAYSAIANNGFFLVPLLNTISIEPLLLYIGVYNILIFILFMPLLFFKKFDNVFAFVNLRDFTRLHKVNPTYAILFSLAFLSLAGVPPFIGFIGKMGILTTSISFGGYFITFVLLITSLYSTWYYIRLLKIIFFSSGSSGNVRFTSLTVLPKSIAYIISILSLLNIGIIVPFIYLNIDITYILSLYVEVYLPLFIQYGTWL